MKPILLIKADSPDVELIVLSEHVILAEKKWKAGRELSTQLLTAINDLCRQAKIEIEDVNGIVVYEGPGSYTGLRISVSVANALGYSLDIPVIGSSGADWQGDGILKLDKTHSFKPATPVYGGAVYTTEPKK